MLGGLAAALHTIVARFPRAKLRHISCDPQQVVVVVLVVVGGGGGGGGVGVGVGVGAAAAAAAARMVSAVE